jgi:hypothetical protein
MDFLPSNKSFEKALGEPELDFLPTLLQTDRILFRIRPRDEKHPVLLQSEKKHNLGSKKNICGDLDSEERDLKQLRHN